MLRTDTLHIQTTSTLYCTVGMYIYVYVQHLHMTPVAGMIGTRVLTTYIQYVAKYMLKYFSLLTS